MSGHEKNLRTEIKQTIVWFKNEVHSGRKIGKLLDIEPSTINKFRKCYNERGDVENKHWSGRLRKCNDRTDRHLIRVVKINRRKTLQDITATLNEGTQVKISHSTVRRRDWMILFITLVSSTIEGFCLILWYLLRLRDSVYYFGIFYDWRIMFTTLVSSTIEGFCLLLWHLPWLRDYVYYFGIFYDWGILFTTLVSSTTERFCLLLWYLLRLRDSVYYCGIFYDWGILFTTLASSTIEGFCLLLW